MVEQLKGSAPLFHPGWRKENGKDVPELKQWYKEAKEATVYAQVRRLIFELEASSPTVHELCVREGLEEKSDAALQKTLLTPKERKPTAAASKTIVRVLEMDPQHGGVPMATHLAACRRTLEPELYERFKRLPTVPWYRTRHFQEISIRLILQHCALHRTSSGAIAPNLREKVKIVDLGDDTGDGTTAHGASLTDADAGAAGAHRRPSTD